MKIRYKWGEIIKGQVPSFYRFQDKSSKMGLNDESRPFSWATFWAEMSGEVIQVYRLQFWTSCQWGMDTLLVQLYTSYKSDFKESSCDILKAPFGESFKALLIVRTH